MQEVVKASEQYYLDVGSQMSQVDIDNVRVKELFENITNVKNWKGPYLDVRLNSLYKYFPSNTLDSFIIWLQKSSKWSISTVRNGCELYSNDCSEWISVVNRLDKMEKIFEALDILVDKGDGKVSGTVRFSSDATNPEFSGGWILYKGLNHKRTL